MQTVLIVIHLMVVIALVVTVLLQRSEGGALGQGGGGGFMTGRGQANALTRATGILAAMFFATSIALTILAGYGRASKSIFDGGTQTTAPAVPNAPPAPAPGTALDALKKFEEDRSKAAQPAPAAVPAPAPAADAPKPAAPAGDAQEPAKP